MSDIFEKYRMNGRTVIVTGGAGLLGKQFCTTLAQAGANVVVADLNEAAAENVCAGLRQSGYPALPVQVNVTDPDSTRGMVDAALSAFGRVDVLVGSAAMDPKFDSEHEGQHGNTFEDYPLEAWKQALDVNLTGLFLCAQAVARPMVAQEYGVIINICSTYGLVGPDQRIYERPGKPTQYKPVFYSVTKAGVLGLTRYLATYYAGKNIRANALTPGGVYNHHDELFEHNYSARAVMGRMAKPDEMNGAILFLASEASAYMTGANLVVDGGWTAW
ncbi:MAG: SDR family oxidoreductase [Chloroflexi bacterium]|jgi:NAD(P)-dependent dehydrogenase (short-subunit alcohol dehydrogenase family)|nr:SDR family oxidoreductase [Anaerolineaceae bacterium]NMB89705.1 SDR family oxidoreductase [Chloroflexota bacterium]